MRLSVIIATYNRGPLLEELLADLAAQDLPHDQFEVIVVDDGSREPAARLLANFEAPYALRIERQDNAGPAAARDKGVGLSSNEALVFIDDDMRAPPCLLSAHASALASGLTVVQGLMEPAPQLASMPIFERFHAAQLEQFVAQVEAGRATVRGVDLCTGNLSMLRAAYEKVGGFDRSLGRSEDRELGVRLEAAGERLGFSTRARTIHQSDHASLAVWRKRAFDYGVYDHRISQKHTAIESADPFRFWFLVSPLSRPLIAATVVAPRAGKRLADASIRAAEVCDRVGFERAALAGTTLCYGLDYFRGVRSEAGSLTGVARGFARYVRKRYNDKA